VNKNENIKVLKEIWTMLNVEGTKELISIYGLIRLILKNRGIDIKGVDKDSVDSLIHLIKEDDSE
jgi:hypothetical protein